MLLPVLLGALEFASEATALLPVVLLALVPESCCSIDSSCEDTWCPPWPWWVAFAAPVPPAADADATLLEALPLALLPAAAPD
jgi:hypothetical protein